MLPLVSHGANLFNLCPFPDSPALYIMCKIYSQSVQPFDHISHAFELLPPKKIPKMPPWGTVGRIVFSLCPFPDESTDVYRIWCQSVHPFGSFPRLKFVTNWVPPMPPGVLWGDLYLAYVHSQKNPQTWTKVGANRSSRLTAAQYFWLFDPLKPSSAPLVSRRSICLAYIHSQMNLHMWAKFGVNRSSSLTASTYFWICEPLKPPKCPLGYWGANCI